MIAVVEVKTTNRMNIAVVLVPWESSLVSPARHLQAVRAMGPEQNQRGT